MVPVEAIALLCGIRSLCESSGWINYIELPSLHWWAMDFLRTGVLDRSSATLPAFLFKYFWFLFCILVALADLHMRAQGCLQMRRFQYSRTLMIRYTAHGHEGLQVLELNR